MDNGRNPVPHSALLSALCPLDGRYEKQLDALRPFFSEEALMRARLYIEIRYLDALASSPAIPELPKLSADHRGALYRIVDEFDAADAKKIKNIEGTTRHDVKAVEYFLKEKIGAIKGLKDATEFVHFALTSEDVNNLAYGLLIHESLKEVIRPQLKTLQKDLLKMGRQWSKVPMLSLTHGQPATPTTVGREFLVFAERVERQLQQLQDFRMQGKFGGAVGNYSAHRSAYPGIGWEKFGMSFVKSLGLTPLAYTTQINPHDDLAELSQLLFRINTILIDCSRDLWFYISRGIFRQKVVAGEVGSSTMPHKVNPIDFENAEGNLGLSNALFSHFAEKLPISRLQRDLSDSTVQRNIGVAFGYHSLAAMSFRKGLSKLSLDKDRVRAELRVHPEVLAEPIQTVLRKHGVSGAYEKLKALTRGRAISVEDLEGFVADLKLPGSEKKRLLEMVKAWPR